MKDFMKAYRDNGFEINYEQLEEQLSTALTCGYCGKVVAPNRGYEIFTISTQRYKK